MFMPPTVYLIEPKKTLLDLNFPTQGLRSCIAEPKVWQSQEANSELTAEEREAIAKRLILAYFLSFQEFDQMLGTPPVSEETFDRFWKLRRLPIDGSFHHLTEYTKRIAKDRFVSTGSDYLDSLVAKMAGLV